MKCSEQLERLSLKNLCALGPFFLLFFFFNSLYATTLELKEFTKVKTAKVYLRDVVNIYTKNKDFKEFLSKIPIDTAPIPEKTKVIARQKIYEVLRQYHLDTTQFKITGSKQCLVVSGLKKLSKDMIKRDIEEFLKAKFPDIYIVSINIPEKKIYVPSTFSKNITVKSKTRNYIYVNYSLHSEALEENIPVSIRYKGIRSVVVAKRDIGRGEKISVEDVKIEKTFNVRDKVAENINQVVGKVAKTRIRKDSVIRLSQIRPDYAVRKKDRVKVVYDTGIIRVELVGEALENGEIGKTILVKNLSSGKKIRCKVIDEKTVIFSGK